VKVLLTAGASVGEVTSNNGSTALHIAAGNGHLEVVQVILGTVGGTNSLDIPDKDGWTAFHLATYFGQLEILKTLVAANVNVEAQTNEGKTALDIARYNKNYKLMSMIEDWLATKKNLPKLDDDPLQQLFNNLSNEVIYESKTIKQQQELLRLIEGAQSYKYIDYSTKESIIPFDFDNIM